jgi:hypothetical protein
VPRSVYLGYIRKPETQSEQGEHNMAGKPNEDIDIHKIKEKVFSHLTSSQDEEVIEQFIRECVTEI